MHRNWSIKINSKELESREGSEVDIKEEGSRVEGFHKNKCVNHDKCNWRDAVGWVLLTRSFLGTALTCGLFFVLLFQRGFFHLPLLSLVMKALTSIPPFYSIFFLSQLCFHDFLCWMWMLPESALALPLSLPPFASSLKMFDQGLISAWNIYLGSGNFTLLVRTSLSCPSSHQHWWCLDNHQGLSNLGSFP